MSCHQWRGHGDGVVFVLNTTSLLVMDVLFSPKFGLGVCFWPVFAVTLLCRELQRI